MNLVMRVLWNISTKDVEVNIKKFYGHCKLFQTPFRKDRDSLLSIYFHELEIHLTNYVEKELINIYSRQIFLNSAAISIKKALKIGQKQYNMNYSSNNLCIQLSGRIN